MLMNPICIAGFGYVSWMFFKDRIEEEEKTLVDFFGEDYQRYRARTPVGIPGIN